MPADSRALIVVDHSCETCGNRWTHSYSLLTDKTFSFWGGTPLGAELLYPIIVIAPRKAEPHKGCVRCCQAPVKSPAIPSYRVPNTEPDDLLEL